MLMYLRMCLAYESGVEPMLESTTAMQEQAPVISKCVRRLMQQNPGDKGPISIYLRIIQQLLFAIGGTNWMIEPCARLDFCLTPTWQAHNLVPLPSCSSIYNAKVFRIFPSPTLFYQV